MVGQVLRIVYLVKNQYPIFNEHCKSTVWRHPIEHYKLETPKPVKLMSRLIEASSNIGDSVLDPCMGWSNRFD